MHGLCLACKYSNLSGSDEYLSVIMINVNTCSSLEYIFKELTALLVLVTILYVGNSGKPLKSS